MNISADTIILIAFLCFFVIGWSKGFLRSVIGPVSLVIGAIVSVQYYYKTQNMITSLIIGILGPIVINIILLILLKIWHIATETKKEFSLTSRIFGGLFTLLWQGSLLLLTLLLITLIPGENAYLKKAQEKITESKTYSILTKQIINNSSEKSASISNVVEVLNDPEEMEKLRDTEEFQEIMEDDTFKELFSDEEFAKIAEEKDIGKLITHPNIQKILKDEELMKKLMAFQKQLLTKRPEEE